MKALVQEIVKSFSFRFKNLKVNVKELTGDQSFGRKELEKVGLVVSTPEKWDVVSRKGEKGW